MWITYFNSHFASWDPTTIFRVRLETIEAPCPALAGLKRDSPPSADYGECARCFIFNLKKLSGAPAPLFSCGLCLSRYESRIRISFCINTQRSFPLRPLLRLENTVADDTLSQNNYLIYRANQWCIPNSNILGLFLFLIGMSIVYWFVCDVSLAGAQKPPSH